MPRGIFITLPSDDLTGVEQVANSDVNIIVQTDDDICLKYKIIYSYVSESHGTVALYNHKMLTIKEIKSIPLTEEDYKMLGV